MRSGAARRLWRWTGTAALLSLLAGSVAAIALLGAGMSPIALRLGPWAALRNFREVDPGRFYRSGQLDAEQLAGAIDALGIRTIINLRGPAKPGVDWYREEVAVAREKGVRHVDVRFSSRSIPRRRALVALLDAYRDAERPILVHCEDGADRAGEASAIYQMEYMGMSNEEALGMLSLRYLHSEWLRPAKRYFVARYRGEEWARTVYDPCDYRYTDSRYAC